MCFTSGMPCFSSESYFLHVTLGLRRPSGLCVQTASFPRPWDRELCRYTLLMCPQEIVLGCLPVRPRTHSADSSIFVSTTLHTMQDLSRRNCCFFSFFFSNVIAEPDLKSRGLGNRSVWQRARPWVQSSAVKQKKSEIAPECSCKLCSKQQ